MKITAVGMIVLSAVSLGELACTRSVEELSESGISVGMPEFKDPTTADEILPYARLYAKALEVKAGENVIIISDRSIPGFKNEAFQRAVAEAGAEPHLVVLNGYPSLREPEEMFRYWTHMWWAEWVFTAFRGADAVFSLSNATHNHSYYEGHAIGQWFPQNGIREMMVDEGVTLMTYAPLRDFPIELEDAIGEKVREQIPQGTFTARVTDLEGTDITLTFHNSSVSSEHQLRRPHVAHAFGAWRKGRVRTDGGPILIDEVTGTIVSSSLHVGPLSEPMKITVENSRVLTVEGGGPFGNWARSMLEKYKDKDFGYYGVGANYLEEFQLTNHPKTFPRKGNYTFSELDASWRPTWRSGKIHLAFGSGGPIFDDQKKVIEDEFHIDFEIYFPTMTIGDKTIIEKGRLAALEDPEVRAVAAKYGDPDVLLREDWTPRIGANGMIDWSDY